MASDFGGQSVTPETLPSESEKTWGILAHLSPIAGSSVGIAPLGPFVVWLLKKEESPYIARQAMESLAFSIGAFAIMAVTAIATFGLMCVGIGIFLVPVLMLESLAYLFYMVIGTLKASEGLIYKYPITSAYIK
ncbi:DUF4870 domain-containing protein [Candidatus Sumerlaeota bacterium]|nr:DUF4870 domain-containing protein [Candidatus Sumerlaeota bacterium]